MAGQSEANHWQIDNRTGAARLVVGSREDCDWQVSGPEIAPVAFSLVWDGAQLWIGEVGDTSIVLMDGADLVGWRPITGRVRIEFGGAAMVSECSLPAVSVEGQAPPDAPKAWPPADDDEQTRFVPRRDRGTEPPHAAPTTVQQAPPGLPFRGPPPMPPEAGMSSGILDKLNKPAIAVPTIVLGTSGGLAPGGMPSPGRSPLDSRGPALPRPGPVAGGDRGPAGAHPGPVPTPSGAARRGLSLPLRTWALIVLTCGALMWVLFIGNDEPTPAAKRSAATPPQREQVAGTPGEAPATAPSRPGAADAVSAGAAVLAAPDAGIAGVAGRPAADDADTGAAAGDSGPAASPAQGAGLLMSGHQREALAVYDELARRYPDQPVHAAIVKILKRRLAERCEDSNGAGPCSQ